MDSWYYKLFGMDCGPVSQDKLIELIKDGSLSGVDEVRFGEKGQWRRIGSIGLLMAHLPFEAVEKAAVEPTSVSVGTPNGSFRGANPSVEDDNFDIDFAKTVSFAEPSADVHANGHVTALDSPDSSKPLKTSGTEAQWWCKIREKEYGPVTLPKLIEWAAAGRLRRDDHVRMGLDPYVRADDLPGLFPELPKSSAEIAKSNGSSDSKAEVATKSDLPVGSGSKKTPSDPALATKSASDSLKPEENKPASKPMGGAAPTVSGPSGSASTFGGSKPSMPVGRPMAGGKPMIPPRPPVKPKSSSGGSAMLGALLPIGLGVAGIALVAGLIYAIILMIPINLEEEVRRLKVLKEAYAPIQKIREAGGKPAPEELKAAKDNLMAAAKSVSDELKKIERKAPQQEQMKVLAAKLRTISTSEYDEKTKSKSEIDAEKLMEKLGKDLGQ